MKAWLFTILRPHAWAPGGQSQGSTGFYRATGVCVSPAELITWNSNLYLKSPPCQQLQQLSQVISIDAECRRTFNLLRPVIGWLGKPLTVLDLCEHKEGGTEFGSLRNDASYFTRGAAAFDGRGHSWVLQVSCSVCRNPLWFHLWPVMRLWLCELQSWIGDVLFPVAWLFSAVCCLSSFLSCWCVLFLQASFSFQCTSGDEVQRPACSSELHRTFCFSFTQRHHCTPSPA